MNTVSLAKLAAEYAKEITIAKLATCDFSPSTQSGEQVAEFYTAVYSGILNTLQEKLVTDGTPFQI